MHGPRDLCAETPCPLIMARSSAKINFPINKTTATEIEKINPLVTEMFLAHTEKGQKRHYAERTYTMLDAALGEMEKVFGLTLPIPLHESSH